MTSRDRRSEWSVVLGIGLLALGIALLFRTVLGPLLLPVQVVFGWVTRIGWPLVLIALGVLIIVRGRRGGTWDSGGRRLYRSRDNRLVGGVLSGFAETFNADVTLVRILYVLFTILTGFWPGFVLYIVAMALMPEAPWQATVRPGPPPPAPPVPPSPTEEAVRAAEAPDVPQAPEAPESPESPAPPPAG